MSGDILSGQKSKTNCFMREKRVSRLAKTGWIEVVCGSMFSGKTEELIKRLRRATFAKMKVEIYKPSMDKRYDETFVTSHSKQKLASKTIENAEEILENIDESTQVVGIDEAQFLGGNLPVVVEKLANMGVRVIISGLDQDYLGRSFEPMPELMAIAEYVTKCQAICVVCGAPASKSQRIVADTDRVKIGASDSYEARCRCCFDPDLSKRLSGETSPSMDSFFPNSSDDLQRIEGPSLF
jgi:thymidine kinase